MGSRAGGCRPAQGLSRGHAPVTAEPLCALRSAGPLGGGGDRAFVGLGAGASVPPSKGPCIGCGRCTLESRCRRWPCWPRPVTSRTTALTCSSLTTTPAARAAVAGKQPFGNPAAIGSQAPFHMGFFAPGQGVRHPGAELRRAACRAAGGPVQGAGAAGVCTGHAYWAGALRVFAAHRQDPTQPHHASAAPARACPACSTIRAAALGMPAAGQALVIPGKATGTSRWSNCRRVDPGQRRAAARVRRRACPA